MKKALTIILGVLGIMVLATPVLAATTLSLTPTSIETTKEENFPLKVILNPQGIKNYTAKVELEYPAELLEVKSFILANDWTGLSQPGYDLVDNTNGLLIKTAGYPGGFSELVTFGTALFTAKKTGKGVIKVGDNSLVLDTTNQNVLAGPRAQTSIVVRTPAPPPAPEEEVIPLPEEEIVPPPEEEVILPPEEGVVPSPEEVIPLPEEEVVPPEEEILPPSPRPLFDVLIEPAAEQVRKRPIIPIFVGVGIIILIIAAYILHRKRKKGGEIS